MQGVQEKMPISEEDTHHNRHIFGTLEIREDLKFSLNQC